MVRRIKRDIVMKRPAATPQYARETMARIIDLLQQAGPRCPEALPLVEEVLKGILKAADESRPVMQTCSLCHDEKTGARGAP